MTVKYIRFVIVKLVLVIFASVMATLLSFLLIGDIGKTSISSESFLTEVIPSTAAFFIMIFSIESQIKVPSDTALTSKYYIKFTLYETSVYAIFTLPLAVIAAVAGEGILDRGFVSYLLLPHLLPIRYGVSPILNYVIYCAIYAAVALLAHYIRSKKPVKTADTNSENPDEVSDPDDNPAEEEDAD